jgi:hypothetical protein
MSYDVYRSLTRTIIKQLERQRVVDTKKPTRGLDLYISEGSLLKRALNAETTNGDTFLRQLTQEGVWIDEGRPTYFIETEDLARRLMTAKVHAAKLAAPDQLTTFAIAIPNGWKHKSVEMTPVLVTVGKEKDFISMREDAVSRRWGGNYKFMAKGDPEETLIMFSVISPDQFDADGLPIPKGNPKLYANSLLNREMITSMLSTPGDNRELFRMSDAQPDAYMVGEGESLLFSYLAKLITNLWVYTQAVDGALVPGLPGKVQDGDVPVFGKAKSFTLKNCAPSLGVDRAEHYRSWHFRQLNDERFYRGEYEHLPRGSRWTFVSEAIVGSKIEPETVVDVPYDFDSGPRM